jgi:hypothetical protein
VDETSRRSNPPFGFFFIAKKSSPVDARKTLAKIISEVSRDHKDPLGPKENHESVLMPLASWKTKAIYKMRTYF